MTSVYHEKGKQVVFNTSGDDAEGLTTLPTSSQVDPGTALRRSGSIPRNTDATLEQAQAASGGP